MKKLPSKKLKILCQVYLVVQYTEVQSNSFICTCIIYVYTRNACSLVKNTFILYLKNVFE